MVRRNDTRKWQLRQWHGRLRPREAKRSSGAGASSEELDAGRWPELAPLLEVLDFDAVAQLAQCSTSWREAMAAWRASTPHVACTRDALRRARGYSDGAVDSEVARDFLLHLSRLYPALQVVECAAHLSLATAHVQRVEARVEVKIATARELTRLPCRTRCSRPRGRSPPPPCSSSAARCRCARSRWGRCRRGRRRRTWLGARCRTLRRRARASVVPLPVAHRRRRAPRRRRAVVAAPREPRAAGVRVAHRGGARRRAPRLPLLEFIEVASALERKTVANLQQARPPARPPTWRRALLPCGRLTFAARAGA